MLKIDMNCKKCRDTLKKISESEGIIKLKFNDYEHTTSGLPICHIHLYYSKNGVEL